MACTSLTVFEASGLSKSVVVDDNRILDVVKRPTGQTQTKAPNIRLKSDSGSGTARRPVS